MPSIRRAFNLELIFSLILLFLFLLLLLLLLFIRFLYCHFFLFIIQLSTFALRRSSRDPATLYYRKWIKSDVIRCYWKTVSMTTWWSIVEKMSLLLSALTLISSCTLTIDMWNNHRLLTNKLPQPPFFYSFFSFFFLFLPSVYPSPYSLGANRCWNHFNLIAYHLMTLTAPKINFFPFFDWIWWNNAMKVINSLNFDRLLLIIE